MTNWTGRAIDLLAPVVAARTAHILESRVLAKESPRFTAPFEHENPRRACLSAYVVVYSCGRFRLSMPINVKVEVSYGMQSRYVHQPS